MIEIVTLHNNFTIFHYVVQDIIKQAGQQDKYLPFLENIKKVTEYIKECKSNDMMSQKDLDKIYEYCDDITAPLQRNYKKILETNTIVLDCMREAQEALTAIQKHILEKKIITTEKKTKVFARTSIRGLTFELTENNIRSCSDNPYSGKVFHMSANKSRQKTKNTSTREGTWWIYDKSDHKFYFIDCFSHTTNNNFKSPYGKTTPAITEKLNRLYKVGTIKKKSTIHPNGAVFETKKKTPSKRKVEKKVTFIDIYANLARKREQKLNQKLRLPDSGKDTASYQKNKYNQSNEVHDKSIEVKQDFQMIDEKKRDTEEKENIDIIEVQDNNQQLLLEENNKADNKEKSKELLLEEK